jgi:hypothetical protein
MKKPFLMILTLLLLLTQNGIAVAGNTLKVSYKVEADTDNSYFLSDTNLVGSAEALLSKKKMILLQKATATKSRLTAICRSMDSFGARVKVTDARGGTAGLGNLNSVSVANIQVVEEFQDLPDEAYEEDFDYEYDSYEDYPDYIEDGYVYYFINANCFFSGNVSLTSSNAYRVYISGSPGPEYSKAELSKMKWSIKLEDV